jgi:hypothetical protein
VTRIAASTLVPEPRSLVFAFLADRNNHWQLAGRRIEPLEIGEDAKGQLSGVVAIRGPFGVRRKARTRIVTMREPRLLGGIAEIGGRTRAEVRWDLDELPGRGTRVVLSASVSSAGRLDRLLLGLGGRVWMERVFAGTLELLAGQLGAIDAPAPLKAA